MSEQLEHGYIPNVGMPEFTPRTEIRRLRTIIQQKNAAIDGFKEYDEKRKLHVKRLEEVNSDLKKENVRLNEELEKLHKKPLPFSAPELKELLAGGDMTAPEYEKFMMLYAYWLQHRMDVMFYKGRLKQGRQIVKDLKKDLLSIREVLSQAGNMELLERLSERMLSMTAHLDTLQQRLSAGYDEEAP